MSSGNGEPKRGGPPAWGLDLGLTSHHLKNKLVANCYIEPRTWTDFVQDAARG
jgi:hypothetical protein